MLKQAGRLLVVLAFGWAASANAGLMLNITSPGDVAPCGNGCTPAGSTYGWAFNVNSTITIDGLGIWDFDADGIGPDVSMGLWVDGGALLASAVISNSSALQFTNGAGGWRFEDIAELLLAPGNYVIGAANYPASPTAYVNPGFSTIAEVTYTGNRAVFLSQGLVRPDGPLFIDLNIIGPNLRVTENAEIPAPATLPLLGLGLAALGYIRRRRITS